MTQMVWLSKIVTTHPPVRAESVEAVLASSQGFDKLSPNGFVFPIALSLYSRLP